MRSFLLCAALACGAACAGPARVPAADLYVEEVGHGAERAAYVRPPDELERRVTPEDLAPADGGGGAGMEHGHGMHHPQGEDAR